MKQTKYTRHQYSPNLMPSKSLGSFNKLLLHCTNLTPDAHQPRVLMPIGTCHETSIIWTKGSGEHACTPRPMHIGDLQLTPTAGLCLALENHLVNLFDVGAGHCAPWRKETPIDDWPNASAALGIHSEYTVISYCKL